MKKTLTLVVLLAAAGCATPRATVTRIDPNSTVDLSGNWNDTDANLVASEMIKDCLSHPWIAKFRASHPGKNPTVRVYPIRNRSTEHINDKFFTKQVERALLNSGDVDVVASLEEAGDVRGERDEQSQFASDSSVKSHGNETGTDFVLNGWVLSQNDSDAGTQVRAFITTMELLDASTNRKAWIGEKRIKKSIARSGVSF
jgi:uncharacterized protein (TIGR02722 family)